MGDVWHTRKQDLGVAPLEEDERSGRGDGRVRSNPSL